MFKSVFCVIDVHFPDMRSPLVILLVDVDQQLSVNGIPLTTHHDVVNVYEKGCTPTLRSSGRPAW